MKTKAIKKIGTRVGPHERFPGETAREHSKRLGFREVAKAGSAVMISPFQLLSKD